MREAIVLRSRSIGIECEEDPVEVWSFLAAARTSALRMRPELPLPCSEVQSIFRSRAIFRARGDDRTRLRADAFSPKEIGVAGVSVPRDPGARSKTDRKSTRLNSSHANISYAVFCLKKKTRK